MSSVDQIYQRAQEAGVKIARLHYCDYGGIVRAKGIALPGLAERLAGGVALPLSALALTALDQSAEHSGIGPHGAVRLVPDPDSFVLLPYVPQTAAFAGDLLQHNHEPWPSCPRGFLRRARATLAERGWSLHAAFETTFCLARRDENGELIPADDTTYLSTNAMNHSAGFATALVTGLESQGIVPELLSPGAGHGQYTLSVRHIEALRAADAHIRVRETLRGVAIQHSLAAVLAPRPFNNQPGNGVSIHMSLWDEQGRNLFDDAAAPDRLSALARGFLGGILQHLAALSAITAPSVNSFRRLRTDATSGGYTTWGHDNFQAGVRIALPHWQTNSGSTHIELRIADNTCNPYLALGALASAGLSGIDRSVKPGQPLQADPAALSEDERYERGVRRLPLTLDRALDQLEADRVLEAAFGAPLFRALLAVRRAEARVFAAQNDLFELQQHQLRY